MVHHAWTGIMRARLLICLLWDVLKMPAILSDGSPTFFVWNSRFFHNVYLHVLHKEVCDVNSYLERCTLTQIDFLEFRIQFWLVHWSLATNIWDQTASEADFFQQSLGSQWKILSRLAWKCPYLSYAKVCLLTLNWALAIGSLKDGGICPISGKDLEKCIIHDSQ